MKKNKVMQLGKYSISYIVSLIFMIFMVFYFYKEPLALLFVNLSGAVYTIVMIMQWGIFILLLLNCFVLGLYKPSLLNVLFWILILFVIVVFIVDGMDYNKPLSLLSLVLSLYVFNNSVLLDGERKRLYYFFSLCVLLILLNGVSGDPNLELPAGKFNPNTCAFLLAILIMVSFIRAFKFKELESLIIAIVSLLFQLLYISRTAIIGIVLFLVLAIILKSSKKTAKSISAFITVIIISLLGIVFAYLYSNVLYPLVGHGKIVIFGKDIFTGRQTIWQGAFNDIANHPIFGVGDLLNYELFLTEYQDYELIMNAHNQMVGTMASFGVIVFILFYTVLTLLVSTLYKKKEKGFVFSKNILVYIVTVLVMSFFDIYFFSAYNWIAIALGYCLIVNSSKLSYKFGLDEKPNSVKNTKITVFTPTYNRKYIIDNLYNSLLKQTCMQFEWVVVDDGSSDGTDEYFTEIMKKDNPFMITYIKQKNGGKHRAVNRGVKLAKGEMFFIVDSDDYLLENAIEKILEWRSSLPFGVKWAGISGLKGYSTEKGVGGQGLTDSYCDATNLQRREYGLLDDKSEVYFTKVLRKYPFKEFEGENFITEEVVYNAIAKDGYYLRWYPEIIYICDYLDDGLTKNTYERNRKNAQGILFWARQTIDTDRFNLRQNIRMVNYYYLAVSDKKTKKEIAKDLHVSVLLILISRFASKIQNIFIKIKRKNDGK